MLQLKLSDAEIQQLKYERYHYPCAIVQRRIEGVYYKASFNMPNKMIAKLVGLNRNAVGDWIRTYQKEGFESLCRFNYGGNKSELEQHANSI